MEEVVTNTMRYGFEHNVKANILEMAGNSFLKLAMLVRKINADYRFLQTNYLHQGVDTRIFTDKEEAFQWLVA